MQKLLFRFRFSSLAILLTALVLGFTACQKETIEETVPATDDFSVADRSSGTIVDIALSNPDFSTLVAAVVKTNQVELLSRANLSATVFAPTNAAFAQLPAPFNNAVGISGITDAGTINTLRQIIRYHVIGRRLNAAQLTNGKYNTLRNSAVPNDNAIYVGRSADNSVYVNGVSKVANADVQASNGVIHVIDKVLLPPSDDIFQVAAGNASFKALAAAVKKAGFANLLSSKTVNFTVFAPTDAAFAKLPAPLNNATNIANISDPATINLLANVLRYHLLSGRVFSVDLRNGIQPPTVLSGQTLTINLTNGPQVKGNGNNVPANIVITNVLATNGVIHAIDEVLLP